MKTAARYDGWTESAPVNLRETAVAARAALCMRRARTRRRVHGEAASRLVCRRVETGGMKLSGWGRYPVLDCRMERLRDHNLHGLLDRRHTLIARGNGRSYGDAALNPDLTLSMLAMDRMQAFDAETGRLTCEAGVLLADVLDTFVPRGWFPPVVPGTKFVTVGGMIAADVHGKNHHRDGSFGAYVESLTLVTADGKVRECSRSEHADLFRATVGGMGLTGVILSATFRLKPIETAFVMAETVPTRDLDETMALFEASRDWPYSVAWIDCLARGARLGRSLVSRGTFMACGSLPSRLVREPLCPAPVGRLTVPFDAPSVLLNRPRSVSSTPSTYRLGRTRGGVRPVHFDPFFFPLDRVGAWNRLYGRSGFVQYQCMLPEAVSTAGITVLLERVAAAGRGSFLAVLKLLGSGGERLLSFSMEGYTLALDFPMRPGTLALLDDLDEITHRHGGRVYFAKDARCTPERLAQGYPRAADRLRGDPCRDGRRFSQICLCAFAPARAVKHRIFGREEDCTWKSASTA